MYEQLLKLPQLRYTHLYVHVYVYVYVRICICTYIYVYVYVYIYEQHLDAYTERESARARNRMCSVIESVL